MLDATAIMLPARAPSIVPATDADLAAIGCRRIELSERLGLWCLVDADDYDWLIANRWNAGYWANTPHKRYAKRNVGAARSTVYLHREVMIRADPRTEVFQSTHVVDHVNGQPLDDRKANLRWATEAENRANRIPWRDVPSLDQIVAQLLRDAAAAPDALPY
jgi:hypothetical protein